MLLGLGLEPCVTTAVLGPTSTMKNRPGRRFVDVQCQTSLVWQGVVPDNPRVITASVLSRREKVLFHHGRQSDRDEPEHQLFTPAYFSVLFFLAVG